MISFLTLPIRLVGIILIATLMFNAMGPLRSFESKLSNISSGPEASLVNAQAAAPSSGGLPLMSIGLSMVAIVSIWLVYQTYRQHIGLANNELRNRRVANKLQQ